MKKVAAILLLLGVPSLFAQSLKSPADYFGFQPGADQHLFDYQSLVDYIKLLDRGSERLQLVDIGTSPMGRTMYVAFISSEQNIANLEQLKRINRQLALDDSLSKGERDDAVRDGKVFLLTTLSMHSTEVGPTQASPLIAYDLVMTQDPETLQWLQNVVLMMVLCHNPDGMDMVVGHYRKYKDTKYEGSSMPGVYHKYVGHDNNRDFITLSQSDTRAIAALYNKDWFPQVMVEKHQMGWTTARYFVPPMHDPVAENVDARLWNWTWIMGSHMSTDMTKDSLAGVSQHYLFDDYWPGSTETCLWKNVIGLLTEAASCKIATPVYIEPNELKGYGKGLAEYKKSINMPEPWPGGWWRLSDIVEYERSSTRSLLKTCSNYHDEILTLRNDLCRIEVEKGRTQKPFYYVFPQTQRDPGELVRLMRLLQDHGVKLHRLTNDITIEGRQFLSGDVVVSLAQPFRAFIKEVLEVQAFPVRHYTPNGEMIRPYDITSWSLPLHRGLEYVELNHKSFDLESALQVIPEPIDVSVETPSAFKSVLLSANYNDSYKAVFAALEQRLDVFRTTDDVSIDGETVPAGSFIINKHRNIETVLSNFDVTPLFVNKEPEVAKRQLRTPRIGLVETYFHDMDAGWTRFILDSFHVHFDIIRPGDFETTDLQKNFDVLIFPDSDKDILMEGKYKSDGAYVVTSYPPAYTKGIGKKGLNNLMSFINGGGNVIAWGRSTRLFMGPLEIGQGEEDKEEFQLPVEDISPELQKQGLYCPGSLVQISLTENHPLTLGLPSTLHVFYRGRPVYETSVGTFDVKRRVIGAFPEKDILSSGFAEHQDTLAEKAIAVWIQKGKGQMVLLGFYPQFRASLQGAYKLLFNALLLPEADKI